MRFGTYEDCDLLMDILRSIDLASRFDFNDNKVTFLWRVNLSNGFLDPSVVVLHQLIFNSNFRLEYIHNLIYYRIDINKKCLNFVFSFFEKEIFIKNLKEVYFSIIKDIKFGLVFIHLVLILKDKGDY